MKIGLCGTVSVGKTTLVKALAELDLFKKYKIDLCIPEYMYAHNGYDAVLEELHKKLMSSLHIHNDTKKLVYIGIAGDIKGCKHVDYETFSHKFSLSFLLGIKEFLIED